MIYVAVIQQHCIPQTGVTTEGRTTEGRLTASMLTENTANYCTDTFPVAMHAVIAEMDLIVEKKLWGSLGEASAMRPKCVWCGF